MSMTTSDTSHIQSTFKFELEDLIRNHKNQSINNLNQRLKHKMP